jgi:hypothetical protein
MEFLVLSVAPADAGNLLIWYRGRWQEQSLEKAGKRERVSSQPLLFIHPKTSSQDPTLQTPGDIRSNSEKKGEATWLELLILTPRSYPWAALCCPSFPCRSYWLSEQGLVQS